MIESISTLTQICASIFVKVKILKKLYCHGDKIQGFHLKLQNISVRTETCGLTQPIFLRCSKNIFIVPTDAHNYKIIQMLKQFKIITLAPTCFGSCRNHHQGQVLSLAKTTKWVFYARRYRRSQCYDGMSACCAGVRAG
jgi:hypothetical protein